MSITDGSKKTISFNQNDIINAYVTYFESDGGKHRPALIVGVDNERTIDVLKITSKYKGKSPAIKAHRYPLKDWQIEGLDKESYVDILAMQKIYLPDQHHIVKRGIITDNDMEGLAKFIINYSKSN
ncbi:hypothetical protein PT287_04960 [Lactobacillus sp. ESL0679]|uniref:hypothetical protein n=1 Tax=Lactobacillus sp. ESL0679 TaxID=2983209 RepID=UPI0023F8670C|nr:hypothetical protein [Lactobacillus sp. ESL0679]MDF7682874.1 hypothetical protein [Lactobacillus sp. ESL0679]